MTRLYDLTEQYLLVQAAAEEAEEGAFDIALAQLEGDVADKVENIAKLIRSLETDADGYEAEVKRLAEQAGYRRSRVRRLKDYLKEGLEAVGLDKIKGQLFTVALQASPPSCRVLDAEAIPAQYQRVIPERREVDARAILEAYKQGIDVPGAEVVTSRHVRIR